MLVFLGKEPKENPQPRPSPAHLELPKLCEIIKNSILQMEKWKFHVDLHQKLNFITMLCLLVVISLRLKLMRLFFHLQFFTTATPVSCV